VARVSSSSPPFIFIYLKARNYANVSASRLYRFTKDPSRRKPFPFSYFKASAKFFRLLTSGWLEERAAADTGRCYIQSFTSV
jgi:hypothetical protein